MNGFGRSLLLALTLAVVSCCASFTAYAQEEDSSVETLELLSREAPEDLEVSKYPDVAGVDVVADAPWRVWRRGRGSWIPLLIFVPDAALGDRGSARFLGLRLRRVTIFEGQRRIFEDTDSSRPRSEVQPDVRDEDGRAVSSDIAGSGSPCSEDPRYTCDVQPPGGWHRIIRLPIDALAPTSKVFLRVEVVVAPVYSPEITIDPWFFSRTLRVHIAHEGLPSLGQQWQYYDAHFHSVAEWSRGEGLLAPRKAFGGPIQMLKETAFALGMTDTIEGDLRGRIVITDHNAFFSDSHVIPVGPTGRARSDLTPDPETFPVEMGQVEFQNLKDLFGDSFGEEVTLRTGVRDGGFNTGSHLLLHRADHVHGPWHGGLLRFRIFDVNLGRAMGGEPNPNTLDEVLERAAHWGKDAFAFAAHPFGLGNHWSTDGSFENDLSNLGDRRRRYVTRGGRFVFKGAQYWNGKPDFILHAEEHALQRWIRRVDFFDLHPFEGAPATPAPTEEGEQFLPRDKYPRFQANCNWDVELQRGLADWHGRIRSLLRFSFEDRPEEVFPRKIYLIAGSDAHGDFNYETSLLATVLDKYFFGDFGISRRTITSNAFGKVRTYVNSAGKPGSTEADRALNALADGNSIATDGPVLSFEIDSDLRFDSTSGDWTAGGRADAAGRIADFVDGHFDVDGRIGGNGVYDGGFTVLVARDASHAALRYRWSNSSEFGPPFGGTPDRLEVHVDRAGEILTYEETSPSESACSSGTGGPRSLAPSWQTTDIRRGDEGKTIVQPLPQLAPGLDGPVAISLAIYARKSEVVDFRAYTNPIWIVPVDVIATGSARDGTYDPGSLRVEFRFDMSMAPRSYVVRIAPLDRSGAISESTILMEADSEFGNNGWAARDLPDGSRMESSVFRVRNSEALGFDPREAPRLAVWIESPRDVHGNSLNSVATVVSP